MKIPKLLRHLSQFQISDEQLSANSIEDNIELMRKAIDDIVDQIAKGIK